MNHLTKKVRTSIETKISRGKLIKWIPAVFALPIVPSIFGQKKTTKIEHLAILEEKDIPIPAEFRKWTQILNENNQQIFQQTGYFVQNVYMHEKDVDLIFMNKTEEVQLYVSKANEHRKFYLGGKNVAISHRRSTELDSKNKQKLAERVFSLLEVA